MELARGIVTSIVAGYYFVEAENETYLCRGRGKLRLDGLAPVAGDKVLFNPGPEGACTINQVLPRTNCLQRPAVANIDVTVVVLSPQDPQPNLLLVDKLLAQLVAMEIRAIVCVNKADLDPGGALTLAAIYRQAGFTSLTCSALSGQGLADLSQLLAEQTAVLAGQSGVGKSHISSKITLAQPNFPLQVGKLSAKIGKGKHTTRQVTLLPLAGGGKIADTPGFSVFELEMDSWQLPRFYPEFFESPPCKFSPCSHIHEPECAVKARVGLGEISAPRYENYRKIFSELQEKEANRY